MPDFESVVICLDEIKASVPIYLEDLEQAFSNKGRVSVRSEKSGSSDEKKVCVSYARMIEINQFIFFLAIE